MPTTTDALEVLKRAIELDQQVKQVYADSLKQCANERNELLERLKQGLSIVPDSVCRRCDAPMTMKAWDKQFCSKCGGKP